MAGDAINLDAILARRLAYNGQGREVGGWTVVTIQRIGEGKWDRIHRIVIRDADGREYEGRFEHDANTRPWADQTSATFIPVRQLAPAGAALTLDGVEP